MNTFVFLFRSCNGDNWGEPGRTFTPDRAMQTEIDRSRRKPGRLFQACRATEGSSLLLY